MFGQLPPSPPGGYYLQTLATYQCPSLSLLPCSVHWWISELLVSKFHNETNFNHFQFLIYTKCIYSKTILLCYFPSDTINSITSVIDVLVKSHLLFVMLSKLNNLYQILYEQSRMITNNPLASKLFNCVSLTRSTTSSQIWQNGHISNIAD